MLYFNTNVGATLPPANNPILAVEVNGRLPLRCQNGNAGLAPAARSLSCEDGPTRGAGLAERITEEVLSWWCG